MLWLKSNVEYLFDKYSDPIKTGLTNHSVISTSQSRQSGGIHNTQPANNHTDQPRRRGPICVVVKLRNEQDIGANQLIVNQEQLTSIDSKGRSIEWIADRRHPSS
jgi:hypothetical protein